MRKMMYVMAWLLGATSMVFVASSTYALVRQSPPTMLQPTIFEGGVGAASGDKLPQMGKVQGVETIIETQDARPQIVANFLERHDSPITPYNEYGAKIVEIADRYNVDFRLLPALAMQESNLCKKIPEGSFNCLGFGIHERGTLGFESYEANFERAAREIKKNYIDIGLTTPAEIMSKYTPSSNGSWAESVNQWMAEMRYDDRQMGKTNKTNADVLEFTQQ